MGSLGDALAGKINGLHVSLSGGRPGSTPSLQIRQSSVNTTITPSSDLGGNASPTPLYVIDGFIADEGAFNNLDINEVENVTVLRMLQRLYMEHVLRMVLCWLRLNKEK